MRRLLLHEKMALENMIQQVPSRRCTFADSIISISLIRGSTRCRTVRINQSFTNYFVADTANANLELIDCHLCLPEAIGNELFLVKDANNDELAFLEFVGTTVIDESSLQPYLKLIHDRLRMIEVRPAFASLVNEFGALFTADANSPHQRQKDVKVKHVRVLVFDAIVCFFFGTSDSLLLKQADGILHEDLSHGSVQLLSLKDDFGFDGWVGLDG